MEREQHIDHHSSTEENAHNCQANARERGNEVAPSNLDTKQEKKR
jgi:hypothetical protein